jgi:hypothetical protein
MRWKYFGEERVRSGDGAVGEKADDKHHHRKARQGVCPAAESYYYQRGAAQRG